jgi:MerR family transcriptional regulator, heat shock protein HspR
VDRKKEQPSSPPPGDGAKGVYGISVTAEMVGTGVQNLRLYERRGLLEPSRSAGGTRLYSPDDVDRLNRITELLADGLNLAGVAMVLDLQDDNTRLRDEASRTQDRTEDDQAEGEAS